MLSTKAGLGNPDVAIDDRPRHRSCKRQKYQDVSANQIWNRRSLLGGCALLLVDTSRPAQGAALLRGSETRITGASKVAGVLDEANSDTERLRQAYDSYAGTYDQLDSGPIAEALGFTNLRRHLLTQADGKILEVGVGTGLNLPLYDPMNVLSITALDLSAGMLQQAEERGQTLGLPISFVQGDVTRMPFQDGQFDSVVDTFSLCVFPDPAAAVREMGRVLKPGGRLHLLEHCRSPFAPLAWYQDITAPLVAKTGKGCVWNQDVIAIVRDAGFQITKAQPALGGLLVLVEARV
eukprot:jgi/Botrbrau1/14924/Bobra.0018s0028.1